MKYASVLGSPIEHSLSPRIHNLAYQHLGIDISYSKLDVGIEDFESYFNSLDDDWVGISLTMPLKESAFTVPCAIDSSAQRIHSANTLFRKSNEWFALSTDLSAFKRLLDVEKDFHVAILGGGGTARAAVGALDGRVSHIDVFNRSMHRAESLQSSAELSEVRTHALGKSLDGFDLVISTLPAGASDELISLLNVPPSLFVESLYKPLPTLLSSRAFFLGARILDGIDLLVEQALDQIALFSGISFDYESMRELLMGDLRPDFPRLG